MALRRKRKPVPTFNCPNCGEEVKVTARACWSCGADDETGWKDNANLAGVYGDLDDDDFDYDEFLARELGGKQGVKPKGTPWWVWVLAVVLLGAFILAYVR